MNTDQRIDDFLMTWAEYTDEDSDYMIPENKEFMKYLKEEGYFTAPASTKYHGAYEGGLYDHSTAVFLRLQKLTEDNHLEWQRKESPFIIGYFHDLCKCDQYTKVPGKTIEVAGASFVDSTGYHYEFNANTLLKGHGSKSVMILSRFINLTEEEMLCIRYHMGAYEKEEWTEFDKAIRKYPNVLWTHLADMLASKVDGA